MVNKNVSLWSYEFLMNGWTMDLKLQPNYIINEQRTRRRINKKYCLVPIKAIRSKKLLVATYNQSNKKIYNFQQQNNSNHLCMILVNEVSGVFSEYFTTASNMTQPIIIKERNCFIKSQSNGCWMIQRLLQLSFTVITTELRCLCTKAVV